MANGLTTQSATPATIPASTKVATIDTGTPGHIQVVGKGAVAATTSSVSASASSTQIIAASTTTRVSMKLYNDSVAACYVKEGTTASTTDFTICMGPGGYWETDYLGRIDAIWTAAAGAMRVTEEVVA